MFAEDRRTIPPYKTHGPGDGRTWAEYFRSRRGGPGCSEEPGSAQLLPANGTYGTVSIGMDVESGGADVPVGASDAGPDTGRASVILSRMSGVVATVDQAREIYAADVPNAPPAPRSAVSLVKLLLENGWDTAVALAHSFEDGGHYGESAEKAGEKKPDFDVLSYSVYALKPSCGKVRVTFWARAQERGGEYASPTCVLRMVEGIYGGQVSDKELKAWITD